jgi:hypothetical protein
MTPGDQHAVDVRLAQLEVAKALMVLLSLHEEADSVQVQTAMKDGRLEGIEVAYSLKGRSLGGMSL